MGDSISEEPKHVSVFAHEVEYWLLGETPHRRSLVLLDCTVGYGGHAEILLKNAESVSRLIGFDQDPQAIAFSQDRLMGYGSRVMLKKGNYRDVKSHLTELGVSSVDGVLFDLGVSSPQLDDPARGFSFRHEGPLDMRMDHTAGMTAAGLVNSSQEHDLADIIFHYGEERYARRIARAIARAREGGPIETTGALASVITAAVPSSYRHGRIHCATRTFQALRIAVNHELEGLASSLEDAARLLAPGGRMCVISFHSLEDRIVKHTFRSLAQGDDAYVSILTKKPILPTEQERVANPRARSAKLRVAERMQERMDS